MVDYQPSVTRDGVRAQIDEGLRAHMNKVYMLMATAMVITGAVAYAVGSNENLLRSLFTGYTRYAIMFAPLLFVFGFSAMINSMSVGVATVVFYAFGAVMGLSISWIFIAFNLGAIFTAFFATAVGFLALSLYGYTTKSDLGPIGRFAIMGLIGGIVLMLINMFYPLGSSFMFALNIGMLLVFAALTAYDTQQIKNEYLSIADAGLHGDAAAQEWLGKSAIMGALNLYLNFINMFMLLLQLMGGGDE